MIDHVALLAAIYEDDPGEVRYQLQSGVDPNLALPNESTLLLEAQTFHVASALIEHGARIDACDDRHRTVLHNLVYADHPHEMALLYCQHGADLEARDCDGCTPLLMVLGNNCVVPDVAHSLLDFAADPLVVDMQGNTALHQWAKGTAVPSVGQRLINAGVDPSAANHLGLSVRDVLIEHLHENQLWMIDAACDRREIVEATPTVALAGKARRI